MHQGWGARKRQLERDYLTARFEFDRLWPERYASPGGDPPIVVFTGEPSVHTGRSHEREILLPIRCQNLAGAVEVVLRPRLSRPPAGHLRGPETGQEFHQITGCTSPRTLITFPVPDGLRGRFPASPVDIFVLDDLGSVLARASVPAPRP